MLLIASRRAFDAKADRFTNNPARLTRYVAITRSVGSKGAGGADIIPHDRWLAKVKAQGSGREVLVYVHGYNTSQRDLLKRLTKLGTGLHQQGFRGTLVGYDWPSDGSVLRYRKDRADAKTTAPALVTDVLKPLQSLSPRPTVHIMAHSMGCYLTLRAFAAFGDGSGGTWGVDQVLFTAGDADSAWLEKGAWGALVLRHRARRMTNYYNPLDDVLALSRTRYNGNRARVGRSGIPTPKDPKHADVYCKEQYERDVPKSERDLILSHNWWYTNKGFLKDAVLTISGKDAAAMPTRRKTNTQDQALLS